jgi:hypothetical protein
MSKFIPVIAVLFFLAVAATPPIHAASVSAAKKDFKALSKPGEKISLDADHYFIYGFDKPPKLGMSIMRVEIFTRDGKRDTSFVVRGDADMPSMRGAHSSGDKDFALSAKGVYLLPIRLVMPGDWEVTISFVKNNKVVFRGAYLFDL